LHLSSENIIGDKLKSWLPILLVAGGIALGYGGWKLSIPMLIYLGLLPLGIGVIAFGIDAIRKRASSYTYGDDALGYTYSYRILLLEFGPFAAASPPGCWLHGVSPVS
jgi:hypothetical protein